MYDSTAPKGPELPELAIQPAWIESSWTSLKRTLSRSSKSQISKDATNLEDDLKTIEMRKRFALPDMERFEGCNFI